MRSLVVLTILAGCGRVNFDPVDDGGGSTGGPDIVGPLAAGQFLKAAHPIMNGLFGFSQALSGDGSTLVVGELADASGVGGVNGNDLDMSQPTSGAVFVFAREGNGPFTQQAYIKASDPMMNARFVSTSLSNNGDVLAVGAAGAGAVYMFARSGATWTQLQKIVPDDSAQGDAFGVTVALSRDGSRLAVGATAHANGGQAYVFERQRTYQQVATLRGNNTEAGDEFGNGIGIDGAGNTIVVGAAGDSSAAIDVNGDELDNTMPLSGAAYVFERSTGWQQTAYLKSIVPNGGRFGNYATISSDGSTIIAGAQDDNVGGTAPGQPDVATSGAARIFVRSGSTWVPQVFLKSPVPRADTHFGFGVALSTHGDIAVVSEYQNASSATGVDGNTMDASALKSGAAFVFQRTGASWALAHFLKGAVSDTNDIFGTSPAMSGDGSVIAFGTSNDDAASTIPTDNSLMDSGATQTFVRVP
ncbi:MAG: FG-GAP repeat protein [Kofleriaceae bacterium]